MVSRAQRAIAVRPRLERPQLLSTSRHVTQRRESDTVEILSGVRRGKSMGSPIALQVINRDSRLDEAPPVHRPRPGHADYAGAMKWLTTNCRPVLERASARETAARVAAGELIPGDGRYLLFTGHDVPTHLYKTGVATPELIRYVWDRTFRQSWYWQLDTTRSNMPAWGMVSKIEPSHHDAGTAYIAVGDHWRWFGRVVAERKVVELAELRYRGGVAAYLEVLDAHLARPVAGGGQVPELVEELRRLRELRLGLFGPRDVVEDLLLLHAGQPLQLQLDDGLRLALGEPPQLFVGGDVQPVLDEHDAVPRQLVLELVDLGVGAPRDAAHQSAPCTRPRKPTTRRSPRPWWAWSRGSASGPTPA